MRGLIPVRIGLQTNVRSWALCKLSEQVGRGVRNIFLSGIRNALLLRCSSQANDVRNDFENETFNSAHAFGTFKMQQNPCRVHSLPVLRFDLVTVPTDKALPILHLVLIHVWLIFWKSTCAETSFPKT